VITDDVKMRELNKQYRNKDKATNVLSFGYLETSKEEKIPTEDKNYLGDIYMSHSLISSEARDLEISPKDRFAHLFVHGLLHLVGHHHDNEKQAQRMEGLEDEILAAISQAEYVLNNAV
jgi:probable rRNA maturation factor